MLHNKKKLKYFFLLKCKASNYNSYFQVTNDQLKSYHVSRYFQHEHSWISAGDGPTYMGVS